MLDKLVKSPAFQAGNWWVRVPHTLQVEKWIHNFGCIPSVKGGRMSYGVIGNTSDFGSGVQGSSPCRTTKHT